jgi:1,4-dihydroxy-2-naphthoate polyprenyltransferase
MRVRAESVVERVNERSSGALSVWFRAIRFHYVPPSFLPAILCSLVAWSSYHRLDVIGLLLVVAGVTINHFGLNLLDDACDYIHSVDSACSEEKNPYTGGSGVLTEGLLTTTQVARGAVVCFATTAAIGLYLAWVYGWPVLAFGLIGVFCSVFYTLPPIRFGYRGLGELGLLINFGPVIGLGAYYIQAGTLDVEPLMVSLVLGMMMWSMIIINEIPDYEEDKRGGKRTLVVRLGRDRAIFLYTGGLAAAYMTLIYTIWSGLAPFSLSLGLLSLPLAIKSVMILKEHYLHKIRMMPANLLMIKVHFLTGVGMIAGYMVHFLR